MHAPGLHTEGNRVVAKRGRDGQHRVGATERPTFRLGRQFAQLGAAVRSLFHGQRRVQFKQKRRVQLPRQDDPGRSVERGPFVNQVGWVAVEPAFEIIRQFLVV